MKKYTIIGFGLMSTCFTSVSAQQPINLNVSCGNVCQSQPQIATAPVEEVRYEMLEPDFPYSIANQYNILVNPKPRVHKLTVYTRNQPILREIRTPVVMPVEPIAPAPCVNSCCGCCNSSSHQEFPRIPFYDFFR